MLGCPDLGSILRAVHCRYVKSLIGTFETYPPILRMSVHRGRPEVPGPAEPAWTTQSRLWELLC